VLSEFQVTVLGASPAWANPGGACSGHLVSHRGDHVLLDCGFGILSRLRERLPLDQLRAIVISHLHADHFMDLVPLRYGLKYGKLRTDPRLPLFVPPDAAKFFARLGAALDGDAHFFDDTYRLAEYEPGKRLEIGSLTFDFKPVKHYIPAYAMAVQAGRKLVYSGDAAPCQSLEDLATGTDLFLCEAAINGLEEDDPLLANRGHMTAAEAADLAQRAGAARLVLVHYRSDPARDGAASAEVRSIFGGPAELAREGKSYRV
jgi:ribonuclease BN (tRNA processing enzyme)